MLDKSIQHFSEVWNNGVWHNLDKALPSTLKEIVKTRDIISQEIPDNELFVDVLLATDSSGSHKQFANKDINVDSRNLNLGKILYNYEGTLKCIFSEMGIYKIHFLVLFLPCTLLKCFLQEDFDHL